MVGGIALAALEMAAAEVTVGLHVSDHGLDGAAASQFVLDDAEDAALLARDEDAADWPRGDPDIPCRQRHRVGSSRPRRVSPVDCHPADRQLKKIS
jgi:hypothetical protein